MKKKNVFICIGAVVVLCVAVILGINLKINGTHKISFENFPKKINSFSVGKSSGTDDTNYTMYRNVTFDNHDGIFYYKEIGNNGSNKQYKFEFFDDSVIDNYKNMSKTTLNGVEYEVSTFGNLLIISDRTLK